MDARGALLIVCMDMIQNTLMLLMTLRVLRVRIRPVRIGFAAIFGSAAAVATGYAQLTRGQTMLLWLPLALGMMRIAAGATGHAGRALRRALTLLACAGFLGGVVLALYGALGSLYAAHAASGVFAGAVFVGCMRAVQTARDACCAHVRCVIAGKTVAFEAIVDSGNSLRDYLTHRPVIVTGDSAALRKALTGINTRLIFADTAGGRMMMQMIIPTETTVCVGNAQLHVHAALAFSPGMKAGMPALVPAVLIEKEG